MRRFLTWLIVCTASLVLPVPSDGGLLKERLGPLVPKDAQWAVSVIDMKTGIEMISTGNPPHLNPLPPGERKTKGGPLSSMESGPLVPGSLMKLFIAGAALDFDEYGCKEPPSPPKDPACAKRTTGPAPGPATGLDMTTTILHDGIIRGNTLSGSLYIRGSKIMQLIDNKYEITVTQTFETNVPAPVIVIESAFAEVPVLLSE